MDCDQKIIIINSRCRAYPTNLPVQAGFDPSTSMSSQVASGMPHHPEGVPPNQMPPGPYSNQMPMNGMHINGMPNGYPQQQQMNGMSQRNPNWQPNPQNGQMEFHGMYQNQQGMNMPVSV